ncbi:MULTISPECIES: putative glycolipid-binding domain-containing protein [Thermomonosporaceae]|uniref:putative glycolipid-binding domain-containing protein n=1 Tax=Thermomonosporaceae TaxID=2012 RepID=UPI00255AD413|nr:MULTISPECIES: putative glycolipid-binding domain-containing protein [Thermomonosporaceae]MDL4771351.1 putative glycolipid-binding domain-containing protein [Actinomadura xylanilytica]
MTRSLVWVKPAGAETADVDLGGGRLAASGAALGGGPFPYRLEYELTTGERYVTARLLVRANGIDPETGPWERALELINRPEGDWTVNARSEGHVAMPPPGGDAEAVRGALDCDLGLSPLTNSMPVLRSGFLDGGPPAEHLMAWVSVPDLAVRPSRQTYAFVRREGDRSVVRYSSPGFVEEIIFDRDGLVLDYPSIGHRV